MTSKPDQVPLRFVRTEEAKKIRAKNMRAGKDDTPFGKNYRELVESKEEVTGAVLGSSNPDTLIAVNKSIQINDDGGKQTNRIYSTEGISPTVPTACGGGIPKVAQALQTDGYLRDGYSFGTDKPQSGRNIRRLTPVECERLQGFDDNWTSTISDTQRYKCLGNAVTTNVIEFLGKRLLEKPKQPFEECF